MTERGYVRLDTALNATLEEEEAPLPANLRDASGLEDGALSGLLTTNATASRAVVSDGSGKLTTSSVTSTELGYVGGVTSAIQTQINTKAAQTAVDLKAPLASPTFTGVPAAPTAGAGVSTTQIATTAFVQAAISAYVAANNVLSFMGVIDCSANPNYPTADAGNVYKVSVAGKIGGASGPNVEANDELICVSDGSAAGDHATVGTNWVIIQSNIDGAVTGPASSTANNFASFNGTTGKVIKDSGLSAPSGAIVGTTDTQTLSNKKLTDSNVTFVDNGDATKQFAFEVSGITTATTRTATVPNYDLVLDTMAFRDVLTDVNVTTVAGERNIRHLGTLTANRTVTLGTTDVKAGETIRITRPGAGAFNLNVGTGPLKALATGTWCDVTYNGSAWYLAAYGAL